MSFPRPKPISHWPRWTYFSAVFILYFKPHATQATEKALFTNMRFSKWKQVKTETILQPCRKNSDFWLTFSTVTKSKIPWQLRDLQMFLEFPVWASCWLLTGRDWNRFKSPSAIIKPRDPIRGCMQKRLEESNNSYLLHTYGFSPVWMRMCTLSWWRRRKNLPQSSHLNFLMSEQDKQQTNLVSFQISKALLNTKTTNQWV